MKVASGAFLLFSLSLASFSVDAQIYICKDASGRTLTSDRLIPECATRAMREMGKDGVIMREIPPPMTAEERRRKEAAEAKKKEEADALEEKRKSDRALMARYRNEGDIEIMRQRTLGITQDEIKREELSKAATEKELEQAQAEAEGYKKKNQRTPADLEHKIDDCQRAIDESDKLLEEHKQELGQINAQFDETLKRYREINSEQAAN